MSSKKVSYFDLGSAMDLLQVAPQHFLLFADDFLRDRFFLNLKKILKEKEQMVSTLYSWEISEELLDAKLNTLSFLSDQEVLLFPDFHQWNKAHMDFLIQQLQQGVSAQFFVGYKNARTINAALKKKISHLEVSAYRSWQAADYFQAFICELAGEKRPVPTELMRAFKEFELSLSEIYSLAQDCVNDALKTDEALDYISSHFSLLDLYLQAKPQPFWKKLNLESQKAGASSLIARLNFIKSCIIKAVSIKEDPAHFQAKNQYDRNLKSLSQRPLAALLSDLKKMSVLEMQAKRKDLALYRDLASYSL